MKEEKESERGYSRTFLASLPFAANQSCVARFGKSLFSKLLILLCHKFLRDVTRWQQGQRGRVCTNA